MADEEEKVVPKQSGNGNLLLIIAVALVVVSLALSAVSLLTVMQINSKLEAPEETEMDGEEAVIPVTEIDTFKFTEDFIFIFPNAETGKDNNVVVSISVGVHNTAKEKDVLLETLANKEAIIRDGMEALVKRKSFDDFKTTESLEALKAEMLAFLRELLNSEIIVDVYFNNLLTTS